MCFMETVLPVNSVRGGIREKIQDPIEVNKDS